MLDPATDVDLVASASSQLPVSQAAITSAASASASVAGTSASVASVSAACT